MVFKVTLFRVAESCYMFVQVSFGEETAWAVRALAEIRVDLFFIFRFSGFLAFCLCHSEFFRTN